MWLLQRHVKIFPTKKESLPDHFTFTNCFLFVSQTFVRTCSHVICGKPSRGEKFLCGCASGIVVLSKITFSCFCVMLHKLHWIVLEANDIEACTVTCNSFPCNKAGDLRKPILCPNMDNCMCGKIHELCHIRIRKFLTKKNPALNQS